MIANLNRHYYMHFVCARKRSNWNWSQLHSRMYFACLSQICSLFLFCFSSLLRFLILFTAHCYMTNTSNNTKLVTATPNSIVKRQFCLCSFTFAMFCWLCNRIMRWHRSNIKWQSETKYVRWSHQNRWRAHKQTKRRRSKKRKKNTHKKREKIN